YPDRPATMMQAQITQEGKPLMPGDGAKKMRLNSPVVTGADGKFVVEGVIPGAPFWLHYTRNESKAEREQKPGPRSVQPGKTLDRGEGKVSLESWAGGRLAGRRPRATLSAPPGAAVRSRGHDEDARDLLRRGAGRVGRRRRACLAAGAD